MTRHTGPRWCGNPTGPPNRKLQGVHRPPRDVNVGHTEQFPEIFLPAFAADVAARAGDGLRRNPTSRSDCRKINATAFPASGIQASSSSTNIGQSRRASTCQPGSNPGSCLPCPFGRGRRRVELREAKQGGEPHQGICEELISRSDFSAAQPHGAAMLRAYPIRSFTRKPMTRSMPTSAISTKSRSGRRDWRRVELMLYAGN